MGRVDLLFADPLRPSRLPFLSSMMEVSKHKNQLDTASALCVYVYEWVCLCVDKGFFKLV